MKGYNVMTYNKTNLRKYYIYFFIIYSLFMFYLLFIRNRNELSVEYWTHVQNHYNVIPFSNIKLFLRLIKSSSSDSLIHFSIINLVGNIVMFIPYGYLLPNIFLKCKHYFTMIFYCIMTVCLIEIAQLFSLRGSCDIDDLLLNILGISIGFFMNTIKDKLVMRIVR